ncbi:EXS-domain-containing protein [Auriscalpium vulgare]|uniref:EXS-domain-containing protein n=1 Tax=Auriscalpium vulgare TaxID=40419 RepID=A0ACB8S6Z2_9AGAM|nr:EXS-domain-containing protein [Auriscalpium vulgare]
MVRPHRWWLLRNIARQLSSGWRRVEFTDFWMGDQFCSLAFTLGNLYFLACAYSVGFDAHPDPWARCSRPHAWPVPFILAALPLLARLLQSFRRYSDSRLITHLINAGKYGAGISYYLSYYLWRHNGAGRGPTFVLWCLFGVLYSTYASAWDLLMDWSVLRPHAKVPLLRSELIYSGYIPISNVLIRFVWVLFIPARGPSVALRSFIAAMLEIVRRFQWNIYRLENEHLGNMDQYRITREVPLPYSFDDLSHETDIGDDDELLEREPVAR